MKNYTTLKVGYTSGVYGCSGEFFNTIIFNGDKVQNIYHYGLYGSDKRVEAVLEEKGYKAFYMPSIYGKLTKNDIPKNIVFSEYQAIEKLKTEFDL